MTADDSKELANVLARLRPSAKGKRADADAEKALALVAFPDDGQLVPLPSELTPAQQKVANVLAGCAWVRFGAFALPHAMWSRRRWLGLDEPGALEREVTFRGKRVPLYRALEHLNDKTDGVRKAFVSGLRFSLAERLEVFADVHLDAYRGLRFPRVVSAEIGKNDGDWGTRTANRIIKLRTATDDSRIGFVPQYLATAALVAVIQGGGSIDATWADLAAAIAGDDPVAVAAVLGTIPEPWRSKALGGVFKITATDDAVNRLLAVFRLVPSKELAALILSVKDKLKDPAKVLAEVSRVAKRVPTIATALVEPPTKKQPRKHVVPVALTCTRTWAPRKLAELTPAQARQVTLMARTYDGDDTTSAKKLFAEKDDNIRSLVMREIADAKGKHVYDIVTWLADDGCVFRAGKTELVAEVVQHQVGVSRDAALVAGLQLALEMRPKRSSVRKAR